MFKLAASGMFVALAMTAANTQAATILFNEGVFGAPTGYTLFTDFNDATAQALVTGSGYYFPTGDKSDAKAIPGNETPFLAITGGAASIAFAGAVRSFSFDFSTIDTYNTVTINYVGGTSEMVSGTQIIGTKYSTGATSGSFIINGNGKLITGISLASASPAFEVDNLALSPTTAPVPEPASWALFIVGFGMIGASLRRRNTVVAA